MHVDASNESNAVVISWSIPSGRDIIAGYKLYFYHLNGLTVRKVTDNFTMLFLFMEENVHVYSVSIQALSDHLPSALVGPIGGSYI